MAHPIAARTLEIAAAQIKSPHMEGSEAVYNTTASFWHAYVSRVFTNGRNITAHDVLQMLSMHAMSNTVCKPDKPNPANFVEQAACVAGAAEAAGVEYPTVTKYPNGNQQRGDQLEGELNRIVAGTKTTEPAKS